MSHSEMSSTSFGTPRPTPVFYQQLESFSTKKARQGTPRDCVPPRPPAKSVPPISRIFANKIPIKALPVSFKNHDNSLQSPHYNEGNRALYFDQCFEIIRRIGVGSFGEVFKVRSKEDGQLYAIKRSRERFRGESDRRRKLEEVAKHEKLPKHPNCVEFVKAWEEKQHLYIQTELCTVSLSDLAERNHNIPEMLICNYVADLLMAVKHLHDNDLVHMDIKPDNIFIVEPGICKLGDFGLVIDLTTDVDMAEAMEGDPKYLAPELLQGRFGKPADIFSLGITILELASDLDLPRGGDLWHELRSGKLPDEFLVGISNDLRNVIRLMMEPNPSTRPTASMLLEHPLIKKVIRERVLYDRIEHVTLDNDVITPPKETVALMCPYNLNISTSEDDSFDDESISINNNSLVQPLDFSASSEDSFKDADGFLVPSNCSIPVRRLLMTPGYHGRADLERSYLDSCSPLYRLHSVNRAPCDELSIYSSSPVQSLSSHHRPKLSDSIVSDSSFSDNNSISDVETEHIKSNIEPKNLLDAFDSATTED